MSQVQSQTERLNQPGDLEDAEVISIDMTLDPPTLLQDLPNPGPTSIQTARKAAKMRDDLNNMSR